MQEYEKLIADFKRDRWKSNAFQRMLAIKEEQPQDLVPFLMQFFLAVKESTTFTDAAFSYVSKQEFKQLIEFAITNSKENEWDEGLESIISHAMLQFPELLIDHLPDLSQRSNESYYDQWIWRKASLTEIKSLKSLLQSNSKKTKFKAWFNLVNIRSHEAMELAHEYYTQACANQELEFNTYAQEVGFEVKQNQAKRLFSDEVYHLIFEENYRLNLDAQTSNSVNAAALSTLQHPSWQLDMQHAKPVAFGGQSNALCGNCGNRLNHLIDLPKSLLGNHQAIKLATCLSCLGWEIEFMYFKHDEEGHPTALDKKQESIQPEFITPPFKSTTLYLTKTPDRWSFQDWGLSNSRENLHRIGGSPTWVQSAYYPKCPHCKDTMNFLAQFDSELLLENNEEFLWGSGGICYAFWCYECNISGLFWQCT